MGVAQERNMIDVHGGPKRERIDVHEVPWQTNEEKARGGRQVERPGPSLHATREK
jgi:hypothetical protein